MQLSLQPTPHTEIFISKTLKDQTYGYFIVDKTKHEYSALIIWFTAAEE